MVAIAQLKALLGLDSKAFKAGAKDAERTAGSLQRTMRNVGSAIAGAFSVGAIMRFGQVMSQWAGDIVDSANASGLLVREMMALKQAAITTGSGVDEAAKLVGKLEAKLFEAIQPGQELGEEFKRLGLTTETLFASDMDPAKRLQMVAKAALESQSPVAALASIFGEKLGPKSMEFLQLISGPSGLPAVTEEAAKSVQRIDDLADSFESLKEKAKIGFGGALQYLDSFYNGAVGWLETIRRVQKEGGISRFDPAGTFERIKKAREEYDAASSDLEAGMAKAGEQKERNRSVREKELADLARKTAQERDRKAGDEASNKRTENAAKADAQIQKDADEITKAITAGIERARENESRQRESIAQSNAGIAEQNARLQERLQSVRMNTQWRGISPDAMQAVGGHVGGRTRAGVSMADRQIRIAEETKTIMAEIRDNTARLVASQPNGID